MKEITLRKWHRYVGVGLMPLITVQILSGLVLSAVDFLGFIERTPQVNPEGVAFLVTRKLPQFLSPYDEAMMTLHFTGGQLLGGVLRILIAIALIWVLFSGTYIFLRTRARSRMKS